MLTYRIAQETDLERIVQLSAEAFLADPLYTIVNDHCKNDDTYRQFVQTSQSIFIRSYLTSVPCLVAVNDSTVAAFAILAPPDKKKIDLGTYLRYGGLNLLRFLPPISLLRYMRLLEQLLLPCNNLTAPNWYLAHLAVAPEFQGQQIGSRMLQEEIIPFVKRHNGKRLTLITQTAANARFYEKNGFSLFDQQTLRWHNKRLENWSFQKPLEGEESRLMDE